MATLTVSISTRYPRLEIAVSTGPRGTVRDTTANASVIPTASTNQRLRPNRLIRSYFMDSDRGFSACFPRSRLLSSHFLLAKTDERRRRGLARGPSPFRLITPARIEG